MHRIQRMLNKAQLSLHGTIPCMHTKTLQKINYDHQGSFYMQDALTPEEQMFDDLICEEIRFRKAIGILL